jgi:hypothetical protein
MRISSSGAIGIGTALTQVNLYNTRNLSGNVTSYGNYLQATVQSDVTASAIGYRSALSTVASAFTLSSLYGFYSGQGTIGAGSTVTNQFGFVADSTLTGATNNYGFYSDIASGTGRYNFYAAGTAVNYFAGSVGIGREPTSIFQVSKGGTLPTLNGTETGIFQWNGVTGHTSTVAIVAGNAATSQIAFGDAEDIDVGYINYEHPNNAFAFGTNATERMRIASTGIISLGAAPGSESLRVTPVASAVNYWVALGAVATGQPSLQPAGSDTNISAAFTTKGTGSHVFYTNNLNSVGLVISHTASAVNYLQVTGGATGNAATMSAAGSDTNIDLALTPKGTGNVRFGTLTANADAPITGYITIKDAGGTTRKLAIIA